MGTFWKKCKHAGAANNIWQHTKPRDSIIAYQHMIYIGCIPIAVVFGLSLWVTPAQENNVIAKIVLFIYITYEHLYNNRIIFCFVNTTNKQLSWTAYTKEAELFLLQARMIPRDVKQFAYGITVCLTNPVTVQCSHNKQSWDTTGLILLFNSAILASTELLNNCFEAVS